MGNSSSERRRFPRFKLKTPLRFKILGCAEKSDTLTNDIGIGGLAFINSTFIAPQSSLALEFNLQRQSFLSYATVIWSAPLPHSDRFQTGVEFERLEPQCRKYIEDYVWSQLNP
jgi:hypothetical protein